MNFLINLFVTTLAVYLVALIMPHVYMENHITALLVALALSFLNVFVKPILTLFTIPITVFSFGLFLLVINALIVLMADKLVNGFHVDGFWWALLFSLVLSVTTGLLNSLFGINRVEIHHHREEDNFRE